jgi:hypothetical protein
MCVGLIAMALFGPCVMTGLVPVTHDFYCRNKAMNGCAKHVHDTVIKHCSRRSP